MKLSIKQSALLPVVSSALRSSGSKNLPVLANILVETEGDKLKLSATNLEIGVIKRVKAENILEEGSITVPARTLHEIVSSLSDDELDIESSGEQVKITTKNFSGTINGISAQEFPPIPLSSDKSVLVKNHNFSKHLPQITFAAAVDEGRPVLTGILTEIKDKKLELVATDGFRLAHINIDTETSGNFKALIPRKTFEELVRLISEEGDGDEDELLISSSENQNQVIFKFGSTELSSRLIEGNFPAWEKIIPQIFENRTIIDRESFLKAIKLASVFAKDSSNIVKIETDQAGLKISSEAKQIGEQQSQIEAQVEGEKIMIAFNSKYLMDVLNNLDSSQVLIEFSGNLSPALIKPVGQEGLEYVIMPIRIS